MIVIATSLIILGAIVCIIIIRRDNTYDNSFPLGKLKDFKEFTKLHQISDIDNNNMFVLKVNNDDMSGVGISKGDYCVGEYVSPYGLDTESHDYPLGYFDMKTVVYYNKFNNINAKPLIADIGQMIVNQDGKFTIYKRTNKGKVKDALATDISIIGVVKFFYKSK